MSDTIQQARERYRQRNAVYQSFGYDRAAAVRAAVDRLVPFDGPVLDVGTGQGLLAIELARRDAAVVSIDVSEDEQRVGRLNAEDEQLSARITFAPIDAQALPFRAGAFGAVATFDALHHLTDGPAVFLEMRRVVKPSGRILLAELSSDGFALVARVHQAEGRVHPVGAVTMTSAVDWFVSHGFRLLVREEEHLHTVAILDRPEQPR